MDIIRCLACKEVVKGSYGLCMKPFFFLLPITQFVYVLYVIF